MIGVELVTYYRYERGESRPKKPVMQLARIRSAENKISTGVHQKIDEHNPHGGWKPRSIEEIAGVPEGLGMGRAVEMLARIYNSKKQSVIRAIVANLQVFSERIDMEEEIISLRKEMSELRELVKQHAKTHAYYGEDRRSGADRRQVDGFSPTGEERRSGADRRQPTGGNHGAEK